MLNKDYTQRFIIENKDIRGEIVKLHESYSSIIGQHAYPLGIQKLLGETLVAAVLLTSILKFNGQLTIQFMGEGQLKMLVCKCNNRYELRGLARFDKDYNQQNIAEAFGKGYLVVTIEPEDVVKPYQSIIPIEGKTIAACLERYFVQSEQLPTTFRLIVKENTAAGILLQTLPKQQQGDYQQFWQFAEQFDETVSNRILVNNTEQLLNEIDESDLITLYEPKKVQFKCSCNLERAENAVKIMGYQEAKNILNIDKEITITCEYCNNEYILTQSEINRIFNIQ